LLSSRRFANVEIWLTSISSDDFSMLDEVSEKFQPTGKRQLFATEVRQLAAHPAMSHALRQLAEDLVAQFENKPLLNLIISDRGRMLMSWLVLYFDSCHDPADPNSGLTVNRFKTACYESGLCSRGRASAMIGILRFAGHIEPAHEMRRGLPLRLVPTEKLRSAYRQRLVYSFRAMRPVLFEGGLGLELLGNPIFERTFFKNACDEFLACPRPIALAPQLELFAESKAGFVILLALIASARAPGVPVDEVLNVPVSRLSARFAVSRAQIKALLEAAVEARLLLPAGSGKAGYLLSDTLRHDAFCMLAALFLLAAKGIRDGAAAVGMSALQTADR
jgi:hypothetical protein